MNPTGEWQEYARLVLSTMERFENDIKDLKSLRESDRRAVDELVARIKQEFLVDIDKLRTEYRDKEVAKLQQELELALSKLKEREAEDALAAPVEDKDNIIRDYKVDSFFDHRTKLYWALLAGGVGTLWAIVEFIIEPFFKSLGG